MKVWWVLAWQKYYPSEGLLNVESTWETREEAEAQASALRGGNPKDLDYYDYVQVRNISDMLGITDE